MKSFLFLESYIYGFTAAGVARNPNCELIDLIDSSIHTDYRTRKIIRNTNRQTKYNVWTIGAF